MTLPAEQLPNPVCWSEGMLLSPQHFQQNHLYWENRFLHFNQMYAPLSYGLAELELDTARLAGGEVFIKRVKAVMPDRMLVDFHHEVDGELSLKLADVANFEDTRKVRIHLVIPMQAQGSASQSATIRRYDVIESHPVVDENTNEGALSVPRLKARLALFAGDNPPGKYISLPLCDVTLPDGANIVLGDYCPPLLFLGADGFRFDPNASEARQPIQHRVTCLANKMRTRAHKLAGFSQDDDERLGRQVSVQHKAWIRALVKALPEFETMADNRLTRPYDMYLALLRVVGAISELDSHRIPEKMGSYDHLDITRCFNQLLHYIDELVETVNLNYTSILFEQDRDGVFKILYDKAWTRPKLLVELTAGGNVTEADLVRWFSSCRIGSASMHKQMATNRQLGVRPENIEEDKVTGLKASPGRALFYLDTENEFVRPGQHLVVVSSNQANASFQPKRITLHLSHE